MPKLVPLSERIGTYTERMLNVIKDGGVKGEPNWVKYVGYRGEPCQDEACTLERMRTYTERIRNVYGTYTERIRTYRNLLEHEAERMEYVWNVCRSWKSEHHISFSL